MRKMKSILYAGDSDKTGAARYLLSILKYSNFELVHVPPHKKISLHLVTSKKFDAYIFSDYSHSQISTKVEHQILSNVEQGSGLFMVGGWGSFSGPFGKWQGSLIEDFLPIQCLKKDDRLQFPGGALMIPQENHAILKKLPWNQPVAVCGINDVKLRSSACVILQARPLRSSKKGIVRLGSSHPLLILDKRVDRRVAIFTSDFAPHWSAGMVDWGDRIMSLKYNSQIFVQVGNAYVRFVSQILHWLTNS